MNHDTFCHRFIAGLIFLISLTVYYLTIAPTTSFWDCGEFIACAYILGVPHPPGAPFYLLLGRVFSMIPWAADIGLRVNIISAITSALTVLFTYLIIVKIIILFRGNPKNFEDYLILFSGGIIGSLSLAFSDSFWFNAVEAEVYAISMFFTAIVVWLILVWHENANDTNSDRYLLLISYCIGLAIGVHLLNILALPAVFIIIYFRKYRFNLWSLVIFLVVSIFLFVAIYPGIVKTLPNLLLKIVQLYNSTLVYFLLFAAVIIVGVVLIFSIVTKNRIVTIGLLCFLLILIGTSTYTGVYLRSQLNPKIDENDPETFSKLVSYINREQYGDWSYVERRAPLWEYQLKKMYLRYFAWQFIGKGTIEHAEGLLSETFSLRGLWGLPFLIGILGMVSHVFRDHRRALAVFILFFMTGFAIVLYLNQPEPQPRERDYVYVGSFFAFALWIGIGAAFVLEKFRDFLQKQVMHKKFNLIVLALILVILIPIKMLAMNYHTHDRTGNYVAYDYSYNLLESCEQDAILFTNGDNDTFPLWFLQDVYHIRTDVRVVNLSLLNTKWHIYQLRDQEPGVPIAFSDSHIDELAPTYWPERKLVKISVPREIRRKELEDLEQRKEFISKLEDVPPEISFELGPTYYNQGLRVQDIMILNIIAANQFRKPIYFAITVPRVNMLNLFDYLRMDGLVYKLVTYPAEKISPTRLRDNLFNKYQYRNLNNPSVYYNDNVIGLLSNYRSAFLTLADFYHQEKMYDNMLETLEKMEQSITEEVIPLTDHRVSLAIGSLYHQAGRPDEFKRRLEKVLDRSNFPVKKQLEYIKLHYNYFSQIEKAENVITRIIKRKPDFFEAYYWLINLYQKQGEIDKGQKLARRLLTRDSSNSIAKKHLQMFEKLQQSAQDTVELD